MVSVSDLKRKDIFRLIDVMRKADEVLVDVNENISLSLYISQDDFAVIKSAALFFGRVSELLNVQIGSCLNGLPIVTLKEEDDKEFNYDMEDLYFSDFSICETSSSYLKEADITEDYGYLYPDTYEEMVDALKNEAEERKEVLDEDFISELAHSCLKEKHIPELSKDFPEFADELLDLVAESSFFANAICYLHSKRVGNFVRHKKEMEKILKKNMFEAIEYLIDAVFEPVYDYFSCTMQGTLHANGEYCSVYCLGKFSDSCERILSLNKRPYANLALALLNRLLTDAEQLAPEILLEKTEEVSDAA